MPEWQSIAEQAIRLFWQAINLSVQARRALAPYSEPPLARLPDGDGKFVLSGHLV